MNLLGRAVSNFDIPLLNSASLDFEYRRDPSLGMIFLDAWAGVPASDPGLRVESEGARFVVDETRSAITN